MDTTVTLMELPINLSLDCNCKDVVVVVVMPFFFLVVGCIWLGTSSFFTHELRIDAGPGTIRIGLVLICVLTPT